MPWRVLYQSVHYNIIYCSFMSFMLVVFSVDLVADCKSIVDDYLSPYDHRHHGSSRSLRDISKCQHTMWNNRTFEMHRPQDTKSHPEISVYSFDNSTKRRAIIGRIAIVNRPLHSATVLEPSRVGGCVRDYWGGATVATVGSTIRQKKCKVAINAGFFTPANGACLGNIVSSNRVVQIQGIQLPNFGIRQDGAFITGYISDDDIAGTNATVPFKELISGVIWLVRNGSNFVNESSLLECDENQKTGNMKTFVEVVSARTAIGHTKDGKLVVAQVEGKTHVSGVNLYDFADILISKGVINAINLDGGGSATFLVDGILTNHPSDTCSDNKAYRCPRRVSTVVCIHDPECTVPDCSGHGECNDEYHCVCRDPWIGYGCHLVNCTKSNCSEHGSCSEGKCKCNDGWTGGLCETRCNPDRYGPNCKLYCPCDKDGHGHCETGSYGCKCDPGWMGWSCNKKCPSGKYGHDCKMSCKFPDCSGHGECSNVNGSCTCSEEWTGIACNISIVDKTKVKSPETFCSWQISSADNVTLFCKVDFGQVINKLNYNLTKDSLNVSKDLIIVANTSTTECLERINQPSIAPFTVSVVVVLLCALTTIVNIITCIIPHWLSHKRAHKKNTKYKQVPMKDENL